MIEPSAQTQSQRTRQQRIDHALRRTTIMQIVNTTLLVIMMSLVLLGCSGTIKSPFDTLPVEAREEIIIDCEARANQSTTARNVERYVPIGGSLGGDVTRLLGEGKCRESLAKMRHKELALLAEEARKREAINLERAYDQATYEERILLDNCYSCTRSQDEFCLAKLRCNEFFPDMPQFEPWPDMSHEDVAKDLRGIHNLDDASSDRGTGLRGASEALEACVDMFDSLEEERACLIGRLLNDK